MHRVEIMNKHADMRLSATVTGVIVIIGIIVFLTIVAGLHFLQPDYDPIHRHMSELSMGPHGWLMLPAFCSIAVTVFFVQLGLSSQGTRQPLCLLLSLAATGLAGAGFFKLNETPSLHVTLVMSSFVLIVLAMYLLPKSCPLFNSASSRMASWGLAASTATSVAMGGALPDGIAQRAAAACVLVWLSWIGLRIIRKCRQEEIWKRTR